MVAYNFKSAFVADIRAGTKRQTIRRDRKRHARPGEAVQIYTGLRTRRVEKIIPDPVCTGVDEIEIEIADTGIDAITVNGIVLDESDAVAFANADGFGGRRTNPLDYMAAFWRITHGPGTFHGKVIRWAVQP